MDDIVAIIVCYFVFGALGNVLRACSAERDETTSAVTAKRL